MKPTSATLKELLSLQSNSDKHLNKKPSTLPRNVENVQTGRKDDFMDIGSRYKHKVPFVSLLNIIWKKIK